MRLHGIELPFEVELRHPSGTEPGTVDHIFNQRAIYTCARCGWQKQLRTAGANLRPGELEREKKEAERALVFHAERCEDGAR